MLGKRHNAERFAWLRRKVIGATWRARGVVDSATGDIQFFGKINRPKLRRKRQVKR